MKLSEYNNLEIDSLFWGLNNGEYGVYEKREYGDIYSMGWDVPLRDDEVDSLVFCEYVKLSQHQLEAIAKEQEEREEQRRKVEIESIALLLEGEVK